MERRTPPIWMVMLPLALAACPSRHARPPNSASLPTAAAPAVSAVGVGGKVVLVATQQHDGGGLSVLVELFPPDARRRGPVRAWALGDGRPLDMGKVHPLRVAHDPEDPGPGPVIVTWPVAPLANAAIAVQFDGVCLDRQCEPMTLTVPLDFDQRPMR